MSIELMVSFAGILVAGLAGSLGVWMERDREAPPRWAIVFSALIAAAVTVELGHAVMQASEDAETEEAMARVLEELTEMAESGDNPALEQFVGSELAAASRNNPRMMKRLEGRMKASGRDPSTLRQRASEGRRRSAGLPDRKRGQRAAGAERSGGKTEGPREGQATRERSPEGGAEARREGDRDAERARKAEAGGRGTKGGEPSGDDAGEPSAPAPRRGEQPRGDKARQR